MLKLSTGKRRTYFGDESIPVAKTLSQTPAVLLSTTRN